MNKELMINAGIGKQINYIEEGKCPYCHDKICNGDFRDELKPCPFCGGETMIAELMGHKYLRCLHKRNCIIEPDTWLISSQPIRKQIAAWNSRAYE